VSHPTSNFAARQFAAELGLRAAIGSPIADVNYLDNLARLAILNAQAERATDRRLGRRLTESERTPRPTLLTAGQQLKFLRRAG
jgi:hypothetical protein